MTQNKEADGNTRNLVQYCPLADRRCLRYFEGYLEFLGVFKHLSIYTRHSRGSPENVLWKSGWGTLYLKRNSVNKRIENKLPV